MVLSDVHGAQHGGALRRCGQVEYSGRGGPGLPFSLAPDRPVRCSLPWQAPNPPATVIELEFKGESALMLGAGYLLIDADPWRRASEVG